MKQARYEVLDYLRRQLLGPVDGPEEILTDPPDQRYTAGVLYPRNIRQEQATEDDVQDSADASYKDAVSDDPIALASQWMPSSVGISFFVVDASAVVCRVAAAGYEIDRALSSRGWRRRQLGQTTGERHELAIGRDGLSDPVRVLAGRANLVLHDRTLGAGHLITVSLLNDARRPEAGRPEPTECLYQVELECSVATGRIAEYPRLEFLTADAEEEELYLTYRDVPTFAIGHGCSADWSSDGKTAAVVRAEFLPHLEVPGVAADASGDFPALRLNALADQKKTAAETIAGLRAMVDDYASWIDGLQAVGDIPVPLSRAHGRLMSRLDVAQSRMRAGLDLLAAEADVLDAFRLANLAMLMQMHHSQEVAAAHRSLSTTVPSGIDYLGFDQYRWYPFQIAFFLLCLRSLADSGSSERDVVDLLWFPTGGGKTEAYLLASAFVVFLRRIRSGDRGAGTTVITRYTLRLLTTQQFQRGAALACAAEMLRRAAPSRLGSIPISIGLWVGEDASPNNFRAAQAMVTQILDGGAADLLLPIELCPWCGTDLIPRTVAEDRSAYGVEATNSSFRLYCPNKTCPFHDSLPVSVVDEEMYKHPPTIIVGTVDKFARLAWSDGGGAFFGLGEFEPPSLIIQDELHLISGPLGTTVGLYETAIEGLLEIAGARPKVIASTATIRRANEQAKGLFGRPVAVFPPSGLSAGDSYFARVDPSRPGRLFVGVMSQNHTPSTALIYLAASLAQAPVELELTGADLDAYWTQVIYHNSLRELGKVVTYARDDIPSRIGVIATASDRRRHLGDGEVVELTSNISSHQIPAILSRMREPAGSHEAISLLLATNMIQVGIDVPRLGLMLVDGQPKTTSEYIQASSRVGRGSTLGLVAILYSPSKPRDRSHYELFRSYHAALYRHVEPTSVTPFSLPSRERALHAALVILVRHGCGLPKNDDAARFNSADPAVARAMAVLVGRVDIADPLERTATEAHLHRLVTEWQEHAESARRESTPFYYYVAGREHRRLLRRFVGQAGEGWETLDSMRSVDRLSAIEVIGGLSGA